MMKTIRFEVERCVQFLAEFCISIRLWHRVFSVLLCRAMICGQEMFALSLSITVLLGAARPVTGVSFCV